MALTSTGQIFMIFYSPISKNTHKMGKISNFNSFEILGHPTRLARLARLARLVRLG